MHIIDSLSKEFVRIPVSAVSSGVYVDITLQNVDIAVVPTGTKPISGDWKVAEWETDLTPEPDIYYARLVIGPTSTSGITLTAGRIYDVYVRVTDNPEIPVRNSGAVAAL